MRSIGIHTTRAVLIDGSAYDYLAIIDIISKLTTKKTVNRGTEPRLRRLLLYYD